jgi:hypothetical protein
MITQQADSRAYYHKLPLILAMIKGQAAVKGKCGIALRASTTFCSRPDLEHAKGTILQRPHLA